MDLPAPAERVRLRLRERAGDLLADRMPAGYQRLGRVLVLRLPEELRAYFPAIGRWWQEELGVDTVLRRSGITAGVYRTPAFEWLAGTDAETEVLEYGVRYRFDASRILFARGNRTERYRLGQLVRPGETVVDLFAGIGYFALPAALHGAERVYAIEVNPVALEYLTVNARINRVQDRLVPILGDNRTVLLPDRAADRVILGLLPSALAWVPRSVSCLRPSGGWLHIHLVVDARGSEAATIDQVSAAMAPHALDIARVREVKPYGPGRTHVVVDARVTPNC